MAARQMEEIERKLATLEYPRANSPRQSLLFAGMERYALLEWLFFRYKRRVVGGQPDKSLFSQQSSLQRDFMDFDEETARIQWKPGIQFSHAKFIEDVMRVGILDLAEIAKFLGITNTLDMESISDILAYNPDEEYAEMESTLRLHLESFLESTRSFNMIYTKEIRPWTHMMEVPQLHGFGPAANHLLEVYKMLVKFLGNLRNLRDAHAALALGSSD